MRYFVTKITEMTPHTAAVTAHTAADISVKTQNTHQS